MKHVSTRGVLAGSWGILGIIALLLFAIARLWKHSTAIQDYQLGPWHFAVMFVAVIFMIYSEGFQGFHKSFSPRVAARAHFLKNNPQPWHWVILAPLFCMSYFAAPLKRKIVSITLTVFLVGLVISMRFVPQPWRGIIDVSVIAGLACGILSLCYYFILFLNNKLEPHDNEVALG